MWSGVVHEAHFQVVGTRLDFVEFLVQQTPLCRRFLTAGYFSFNLGLRLGPPSEANFARPDQRERFVSRRSFLRGTADQVLQKVRSVPFGDFSDHFESRFINTTAFRPLIIAGCFWPIFEEVPALKAGIARQVTEANWKQTSPLPFRRHSGAANCFAILLARLRPSLHQHYDALGLGHPSFPAQPEDERWSFFAVWQSLRRPWCGGN